MENTYNSFVEIRQLLNFSITCASCNWKGLNLIASIGVNCRLNLTSIEMIHRWWNLINLCINRRWWSLTTIMNNRRWWCLINIVIRISRWVSWYSAFFSTLLVKRKMFSQNWKKHSYFRDTFFLTLSDDSPFNFERSSEIAASASPSLSWRLKNVALKRFPS